MEKGDRKVEPRNVALCVRTLNHTIGELARCYGTHAVVAALTEVMGCTSCRTYSVDSLHALVEHMGAPR